MAKSKDRQDMEEKELERSRKSHKTKEGKRKVLTIEVSPTVYCLPGLAASLSSRNISKILKIKLFFGIFSVEAAFYYTNIAKTIVNNRKNISLGATYD